MGSLMKDFKIVTDGAAVMARVANGSVSGEIHKPDKARMGFLAHFLNNNMKAAVSNTNKSSGLQVGMQDFRSINGLSKKQINLDGTIP